MEVTVIRANRRTVGIQVNSDGTVTVRAPKRVPAREIERILLEKDAWIRKRLAEVNQRRELLEAGELHVMDEKELRDLARQAANVIPGRVEYYAKLIGVTYGRITIRNQKTRWGSCSAKGNLNFNCLLLLAPSEVLDYIVVHELCHRKEMNHSAAFWNEVKAVFPDYKEAEKWLRREGTTLIMGAVHN